jgi:hypothetical protein
MLTVASVNDCSLERRRREKPSRCQRSPPWARRLLRRAVQHSAGDHSKDQKLGFPAGGFKRWVRFAKSQLLIEAFWIHNLKSGAK